MWPSLVLHLALAEITLSKSRFEWTKNIWFSDQSQWLDGGAGVARATGL